MKMFFRLTSAVFLLASLVFAQSAGQTGAARSDFAPSGATAQSSTDKTGAYYHFSLGHIYEEMATMYGQSTYANKAIDEYKLAIASDPSSEYLNSALAELYAKTGRIRDAVLEAQDIIKRDPSNIEARKLLGRIYLRSLGDTQAGTQSSEVLNHAIEQYEAITKLDPKSVDDHLLLGRLYRLNNDLLKAENEFKTAVKLQPDSEEAVTTLAYLYNEEGDSSRASQVLAGIADADRSSRVYSALGYTYEQQKDYKHAIEAYRKSADLDHDNLDAVRGLAQNLMNDGQSTAALQQYNIIVEADPQDAQSYLRMAEIYRRDKKYDQALETLKKAENYMQEPFEVPFQMALVYETQGRFDEAIQVLQDLIHKTEKPDGITTSGERNNRATFLTRLGRIYRDTGKYQLAVDTFHRMLDLGDDNAGRGYAEMVETYRTAKMWPQATVIAKEGVAKLPQDKELKLELAREEADTGDADAALSQAKALLKGTPEDRDVYMELAQMTTRLKRFKEAEEYSAKALQFAGKPEEKEQVWFVWGSVLERQKKYDEAEEMFKRALSVDAHSADVLNYLGYMLADRGVRLEEALSYLKQAVNIEPQSGAFLDSLGWAYFKLGDYDLAEENLRHAAERMNGDPTVHDHLGELYAKTGRLKLAAANWEIAIEEWNKSVPADIEQADFARVQKQLESAKVKLAREQDQKPQP
jgi:tetratricopeptide (TPR) repeat protein